MNVILMSSGEFGVPTLRAIAASGHTLLRVITQPARPAGRKGKLRATPIATAAAELGLKVTECPDVNAPEFVAELTNLNADVICVVDFGQIIRAPARESARLEAFNLHGSILPALRGAAPVNRAILDGLTRTGVTTFLLADGVDTGDIYLTADLVMCPAETSGELRARLAELGAPLVIDTLDGLEAGTLEAKPQDHSQATDANKLSRADGFVDFTDTAQAIRRRVHGLWPWPGVHAVFCPQEGKLRDVILARVDVVEGDASGMLPGTLDGELRIATGEGFLQVLELKPAGKALMDWRSFVNGMRPKPGDQFESEGPEGTR
jgi:methionyl-tRNA formyltransferase